MGTNSYVQVPPDSTGKKLNTQQHSVSGNTVETQVFHLADHTNPSHLQHVDAQGQASVRPRTVDLADQRLQYRRPRRDFGDLQGGPGKAVDDLLQQRAPGLGDGVDAAEDEPLVQSLGRHRFGPAQQPEVVGLREVQLAQGSRSGQGLEALTQRVNDFEDLHAWSEAREKNQFVLLNA